MREFAYNSFGVAMLFVALLVVVAYSSMADAESSGMKEIGLGCVKTEPDDKGIVEKQMKNTETDSEISVEKDGSVKVCNKEVPKDKNGKPTRSGTIKWCDSILSNKTECSVISKENQSQMDLMKKMTQAFDKRFREEQRVKYHTKETLNILHKAKNNNIGNQAFYDPLGILVPKSELEELDSGSVNKERYVDIPLSEIGRIASQVPENLRRVGSGIDEWAGSGIAPVQSMGSDLRGMFAVGSGGALQNFGDYEMSERGVAVLRPRNNAPSTAYYPDPVITPGPSFESPVEGYSEWKSFRLNRSYNTFNESGGNSYFNYNENYGLQLQQPLVVPNTQAQNISFVARTSMVGKNTFKNVKTNISRGFGAFLDTIGL